MDSSNDKAKRVAGSKPSLLSGTKSTLKGMDAAATAATKASTGASGSRLGASTVGSAAAKPERKPVEEVKDGESSGYSDFDEEEIA